MSLFYRVRGLSGLDGLFVEVEESDRDEGIVSVLTLISPNTIVGDRNMRFPLPKNALFLDTTYLVAEDDPNKQYSAQNPFGKMLYEGRFTKDLLEVVTVEYTNAVSITITEKSDPKSKGMDKTIYTQNFFALRERALGCIDEVMHDVTEVEDLVFQLKDLKEEELNG